LQGGVPSAFSWREFSLWGSYRTRRPSAGIAADGDGKLVRSPADRAGRYEPDGLNVARQADEA